MSPVLKGERLDSSIFTPLSDTLGKLISNKAMVYGKIRVDSAFEYNSDIVIYFNNALAEYPFRQSLVDSIYTIAANYTNSILSEKKIRIVTNGSALEELVTPFFEGNSLNKESIVRNTENKIVRNTSLPFSIDRGLQERHIAVWQSHGLFFEQRNQRWQWQRATLFQTVEDLYTQSYVVPFLVPMLENAGASVFMPRERDYQNKEYLIDHDIVSSGYYERNGREVWDDSPIPGFNNPKKRYLSGENPFKMGSARITKTIKNGDESICAWIPEIDTEGNYAVYISYQSFENSSEKAQYKVIHSGGETHFTVNQTMGGGTWIYLGTFHFRKNNPGNNEGVYLSNKTGEISKILSSDAVKIGGGMGNIARNTSEEGFLINRKSSSDEPLEQLATPFIGKPHTSGYPRFTEGARYWLQWAGFNDTIYSPNKDLNDYNDDYMSRGKWVNVLSGGSIMNPDEEGYAIPLDLSLAFHTDAGTTLNDSIIGTLGIYTRYQNKQSDMNPDGSPRLQNRYLTDLIQTQIVEDIKHLHEPIWQRRGIWDRSYSESRTPVIPAMLLELLSHQNFADMRYGLDPEFRFDVSRSIYKGMIKFLSMKHGTPYVIQPLPVNSFSAILEDNKVRLKWRETIDSLEQTARPDKYIIYTRIEGKGFDNGIVTDKKSHVMEIESGKIYSFKIAAINRGGVSFTSEILSVYKAPVEKGKALIINGFDRISAPLSFASKDTMYAGFTDFKDSGVPYIYDISYIGEQFEFRREIPWLTDNSPGFGASYSDYETKVVAGNTFDYPYLHGTAFAENGYSFSSTSKDALDYLNIDNHQIDVLDVILGKQRQIKKGRAAFGIKYNIYTASMMDFLSEYAQTGGNILISGANVATDLWDSYKTDSLTQNFATNILKYSWITDQASKTGQVKAVDNPYGFTSQFNINNLPNSQTYSVESPDGIRPEGKDTYTIMRYSDNNISAGVAHKGKYKTVILGFPIEVLSSNSERDTLLRNIINFFNTK
jgi:hypothetical protein